MFDVARWMLNPWVLMVLIAMGVALPRPLVEVACVERGVCHAIGSMPVADDGCCCASEREVPDESERRDDRSSGGCECPKRVCPHGTTAVTTGSGNGARMCVSVARRERAPDRVWTPSDAGCDLLRPPRA